MNISQLSPEQTYAYNRFINGDNLFITGPGGTGKTMLIKHMVNHITEVKKNISVCAMTGCAAVLLNCNARTLHSWSGIRIARGTKDAVVSSVLRNRKALSTWKKAKGIILDEVSMLSKKVFEIIEEIARKSKMSSLPFGGMQVVFTGDFYQLPPVGNDGEPDTELFCFESPIWNRVFKPENHIELTTMFRQIDPQYIDILLQIRTGELSEENKQVLNGYVKREYKISDECPPPTKLFPIRSKTDYVNNGTFAKLIGKEYGFEFIKMVDCKTFIESGKAIPADAIQRFKELSSEDIQHVIEQMIASTPCAPIVRLKKGASVMCTVNIDIEQSICNGSQGIVIDMIETGKVPIPVVRFTNGIIKKITPHFWQSEEYPSIGVGQIPLCLAWALTIHKIQGATLEMAEIDIGQSIFEYGQTYVALSRIKSLEGLYLSSFQPERIRANPKVKAFYGKVREP